MYLYTIKSNRYFLAGRATTYWYIVDSAGRTYHYSDGKCRNKSLKQMRTHAYYTAESAISALEQLNVLAVRMLVTHIAKQPLMAD